MSRSTHVTQNGLGKQLYLSVIAATMATTFVEGVAEFRNTNSRDAPLNTRRDKEGVRSQELLLGK